MTIPSNLGNTLAIKINTSHSYALSYKVNLKKVLQSCKSCFVLYLFRTLKNFRITHSLKYFSQLPVNYSVSNISDLLTNLLITGDSISSAELLLLEHQKLLPESRQLQERAIKITKATEQLVSSGCFAGEQATAKAYSVLSATSDYLADLDAREQLLTRALAFFRNAHTVIVPPSLCRLFLIYTRGRPVIATLATPPGVSRTCFFIKRFFT